MFLDHYKLREQPFGVTPDPRFLLDTPSHREALGTLLYGIQSGRGFLGLISPPGLGKTTLLFRLMEELRGRTRTAFLFQTQCDSDEFLALLLTDLDESTPKDSSISPRISSRNSYDWQLICARALACTHADGAAVLIKQGPALVCVASAGTAPPLNSSAPLNDGLSGACFRSGKTTCCTDSEHDYRVPKNPHAMLPYKSFVITPIISGNEVIAVVEVFSSRRSAFGPTVREALTQLCTERPSSALATSTYSRGLALSGAERASMHEALHAILVREADRGVPPVVIVDEAQNLSNSVLETIRLLSDFETPRSKLLQVVLAGQTELRDRLALPALVQFRQRMSMMSALAPLDRRQVTDYIAHRLQVAGYRGSPLFTPEACDLIADFSSGIPRNVNNICFQAMSLGCVHRVTRIDIEILREVIKDLNWQTARPAPVEHALTPRIIAEERKWEGTVRPAETHGKPELQPNRTRAVLTADNSPHQGSQGFLPRVPAPWRIGTQWSRSAALVTVVSVIFIVGVVLIWRGEAFLNWRNEGFPNPQKLALTNNQGVMLNPAQLSAGTAPPTTSVHTASTHGSGSRRLVPAHVPTEERLIEATTPQPNSKAPQMPAIDPQSAAPSDRSVKLPTTIPNNDFGMAKDSEMNVTPGAKPPDQNLFTGGAISSITSKKSDPPLTSISEKTSGSAPDVSSNTPPENPEPNKIIEGALLKMVRPTYPEVALRARIQGDVVLSAMVTKDGNVRDVRVISGHPTLTSAAVNAVKQWRYEASLVNGRPEDVRKEIVVKFNLASR